MRTKRSFCIMSILLFIFSVAFATTINAQDVKFEPYASIRMYTGYYNQSKELKGGEDSDLDLLHFLHGNSRLGGNFTVSDKLSGTVEMALSSTIGLRHAYAVYKFDQVDILLGQTYTPNTFFSSEASETDNGNIDFGCLYDRRQPMLKLSTQGAYLALIKPTLNAGDDFETTFDSDDKIDSTIPKIAIGYEFASDMLNLGLGFGYQTFKFDDGTDAGFDGESINAYIGYLHGEVKIDTISILFNVGYGINFGNYGITNRSLNVYARDDGDEGIEDTTCLAGLGEIDIKVGEMTLRVGGGYAQADNDLDAETDAQWLAFVNIGIPVDTGLTITPEFSYRDYMKTAADTDDGTEWYAGAKFQADLK